MARPTKLEAALKHELGVERRLLEMVLKRVDEETQKDNLTGALHYRSRMEKIEAQEYGTIS